MLLPGPSAPPPRCPAPPCRLAGILRNLSSYYYKEPTLLFLVRVAQVGTRPPGRAMPPAISVHAGSFHVLLGRTLMQPGRRPPTPYTPPFHTHTLSHTNPQGLVHMGKGLLTLSPYHSDHTLLNGVCVCGRGGLGCGAPSFASLLAAEGANRRAARGAHTAQQRACSRPACCAEAGRMGGCAHSAPCVPCDPKLVLCHAHPCACAAEGGPAGPNFAGASPSHDLPTRRRLIHCWPCRHSAGGHPGGAAGGGAGHEGDAGGQAALPAVLPHTRHEAAHADDR